MEDFFSVRIHAGVLVAANDVLCGCRQQLYAGGGDAMQHYGDDLSHVDILRYQLPPGCFGGGINSRTVRAIQETCWEKNGASICLPC